jgi:hypothetical protein
MMAAASLAAASPATGGELDDDSRARLMPLLLPLNELKVSATATPATPATGRRAARVAGAVANGRAARERPRACIILPTRRVSTSSLEANEGVFIQ